MSKDAKKSVKTSQSPHGKILAEAGEELMKLKTGKAKRRAGKTSSQNAPAVKITLDSPGFMRQTNGWGREASCEGGPAAR